MGSESAKVHYLMLVERPIDGCAPSSPWRGVLITARLSPIVSGTNVYGAGLGGPSAHPDMACSRSHGQAQDGFVGCALDPRVRTRLREREAKGKHPREVLRLEGIDCEGDRFEGGVWVGRGSNGLDHSERATLLGGT